MSVDLILTPERLWGATALVAAYAGMCWGIAVKQRKKRLAEEAESRAPQGDAQAPAVLVTYASQTGQAEALARATSQMLVDGGLQVHLLPVEKLSQPLLQQYAHSLWMLSTTGEGDAPDHALGFVQKLMPGQSALPAHQSLVLALGDHEYQQFCAFGCRPAARAAIWSVWTIWTRKACSNGRPRSRQFATACWGTWGGQRHYKPLQTGCKPLQACPWC